MAYLSFVACSILTGIEVVLYATTATPFALGGAVVCGLMAVSCLVMAVNQ